MTLDPAACVEAIKKHLKKRADKLEFEKLLSVLPILRFLKRGLKNVIEHGYMLARAEKVVIAYFAAWDNMTSQVEALLADEEGIECERRCHHVLLIYPVGHPPSEKLRQSIGT